MAILAKSKYINLSLTTNGSLLNENNISKLLQIPFDHISISLESQDITKYNEIRGGDLEIIKKGIQSLIAMRKKENFKKPVVSFSVTVLKDTKNELLKIAGLYQELKLDGGIFLQPLQTMGIYYKNYSEKMKLQVLSSSDTEELYMFTNHLTYQQIINSKSIEPSYYDDLGGNNKNGRKICTILEKSMFINFEGYVVPCCFVKDYEKYNLGKIGTNNYNSIVSKRDDMIKMFDNGIIPEPCEGCHFI
jgi:radical SAM protein with 4Fe4S-binding SPASM domain